MPESLITKPTRFVCYICRDDFNLNEIAIQCRICLALYHKEHLENMLRENQYCPVCNNNLRVKKNIAKIKITEKPDTNYQVIVFESFASKNRVGHLIIKITMTLFGLILLGLTGLFLSGLGDQTIIWYQKIGIVITVVPIIASSIAFFSIAFEKGFWEKLVLTEKKITIYFSKNKKALEISPENLKEIKISTQNKSVEKRRDGTNMVTQIKLTIVTAGKTYTIGPIKSYNDEFEALDCCKELADYFKKNYSAVSEIVELQPKKKSKILTILLLSIFILLPLIGIILFKI